MSILRVFSLVLWVVSGLLALPAYAAVDVRDVRLWTAPDHTRVVVDLSRSATYQVFSLHNPERVVIDIQKGTLKRKPSLPAGGDPVVGALRYGNPQGNVLRIVLDVKEKVKMRSFLLKAMQGKPYRIVIDLLRQQQQEEPVVVHSHDKKQIIIAVDAGHGGEDPGAIGAKGLREKDVTLQVAKKLAAIINKKPGMKAVLIRKGDYFVPLKKRVALVRKAKADLMVSIHADAVRTRSVKGASVYTLSERGASPSKVAAALAAKENAADAVGGVMPMDAVDNPTVRDILGDMARRDSLNSSQMLAENMIAELKKIGTIKYREPKRARFVVLGALEVPSVLVEMDYISNPKQERKLKSKKHQQKLATALYHASLAFLERMGMLDKGSMVANAR